MKYNILMVEDDLFKSKEIESVVLDVFPDCLLDKVTNVKDAVCYLSNNTPDKIILDMSLPCQEAKIGSGAPLSMPDGGVEIMMELEYSNKKDIPIIILTQFNLIEIEGEHFALNDSEEKIKKYFDLSNVVVSFYDPEKRLWVDKVQTFLRG